VLENLQSVNVFSPSVAEIIINLLISFGCSFIISLIYRFTYKGPAYSESFANSIVFLSIITSLVIMVIGNNLARAFGLVGALSIIRFRTAVKDTIDIVYIFLALTIGMAAGVGYYKIALTGTVIMGFFFIVLTNRRFALFVENQYVLQLSYADPEPNEESFLSILSEYCRRFEIINIRSNEIDKCVDYSYYLFLRKNRNINSLLRDLRNVRGVRNINMFFDRQNS
jgi:uncharacterized membrane protein YhiD involved in acid resistance